MKKSCFFSLALRVAGLLSKLMRSPTSSVELESFFAGISSSAVRIRLESVFLAPSGGLASRADISLKVSSCTFHREQLAVKRN